MKKVGRKKDKKQQARILIYLIIILTFIFLGYLLSKISNPTGKVIFTIEKANVTRAIDGDTIEIDKGRVRLLGINTPEKRQYYYEEAKNYLSELEGKEVELEIKGKDRYGRILAYVNYEGKLVNKEILEQGLGHYYSYSEDKYSSSLKQAELVARLKQIGVWEKSEDKCASCIVLGELDEKEEYVLLKNKCNFNCELYGWTIKDDASHIEKLGFSINALNQKTIHYKYPIWNDDHDTLYLRDKQGLLVLWYRY